MRFYLFFSKISNYLHLILLEFESQGKENKVFLQCSDNLLKDNFYTVTNTSLNLRV